MPLLKEQSDSVNIAYILEQELRSVSKVFSMEFNETKDPELKELLNDITPTLISLCFKLEQFYKSRSLPFNEG
jgi:hypothetical protein